MSFDITSLYPSLIASLLGAAIATGHLAMLRIGVQRINARSTSAKHLAIMSLVRILSVAALLVVLAQQLDAVPLLFLGVSYVVSRIILVPKFIPNAMN